eukprot:scaffold284171_cov15-Tisochrysis_lutea.AAC.1
MPVLASAAQKTWKNASCWAVPGGVIRSPGDAVHVKECQSLRRLAHLFKWVTLLARFPVPLRRIGQHSMV